MTIVQAQLVLERGQIATLLCVLCAIGGWAWWRTRRSVGGTTLVAKWCWTLAALLSVVSSELIFALSFGPADVSISPWRFLAGAATFCPTMAVLGAKRPQDRAWQWIVASLWLIVAWPALEALVYRPDRPLQLHWARQAFLVVLLGIEAINVLGTRRWLSGLTWIAGQTLLFSEYLPLIGDMSGAQDGDGPQFPVRSLLAVALFSLSLAMAGFASTRPDKPRHGWPAVWLDFRDEFGTIWSLRVIERFNSAATLCDWNLRLSWGGPFSPDTARPAHTLDDTPAARQSLLQLFRRFVSPEWLAARGVV